MSKKKILLIDFDSEFLKFLSQHLREEGYEIVTASDGVSGFEKFSEHAPDLVIMEAMLPKFHGFELCSRITSHPTKKSPVIIVTGIYKDTAYKTEALKNLGASAYFEKPINLEELMKKVYELIGRPAAAKGAPLTDNVDDLLKSALSLDTKKVQPKPQPKEEPVKKKPAAQGDDLDKLLESKLKDLITDKTEPETKIPTAASPKQATPSVQVKKPSAGPVSEPVKPEVKTEPVVKSSIKEPAKEVEASRLAVKETEVSAQTTKKIETPAPRETKIEQTAQAAAETKKSQPVPVSSPFEKYLKEEEEETEKKKGAGKFIGIGLGVIVVIGLVGFLVLKKKETPTFTGQTSNQTAAIQTVSSNQTNSSASDQDINQQIEKQIAEYKNQKTGSSTSQNERGASGSRTNRRVEAPVAAAPLAPNVTPSLAVTQPTTQSGINEAEKPATEARTSAEEKKDETSEHNAQQAESQQGAIPTAKAKTGDLVPLNTVEVEPRLIKRVEPVYPELERRMGIKGNVILNVLISETGDVLEVAVIRGIKGSVALEKEAVNAVKKWKFLPAEKDGVKVRVWKPITIGFGLNK